MMRRSRAQAPPELRPEAFLRMRAALLGRDAAAEDESTLAVVQDELRYIASSGDLVGVVRAWIGSDEFLHRWGTNTTFERVQGREAWSAVDHGPRPLVHLHVPKTAGTSLNAVLQAHFDPLEIFVQRPLQEFLAIPLARILSLRLVTGHFGLLPADLLRHRDPIVFSMVRDPFDYYPSLWRFLRKVEALDPAIELREWLETRAMTDRQAHAIAFDPRDAPGFVPSGEGRTRIVGELSLREQAEVALDQLTVVAPSDAVADLYVEICARAGLEPMSGAFPRLNTTEAEPLTDDEREMIERRSTVDRWLFAEIERRWAERPQATPTPA